MSEVHVTLTNATNSNIPHGITIVFHNPAAHPLPAGAGVAVSKSAGKTSGTTANVVINNPA